MRSPRRSGGQASRRSGSDGFGPERPNARTSERPRLRPKRRAFTLIEMLVLIIIMVVLSSVAVPAYLRFLARSRFQHSTQNVVGLLSWARDSAIQYGADTVVRFDAQTETFIVTSETPETPTDVPLSLQDRPDSNAPPPSRTVSMGEDVIVTDFTSGLGSAAQHNVSGQTTGELRFHEDGRTEGARMVLRSAYGYGALVEVSPSTGEVRVLDEIGMEQ